jgi:emfourin
VKVSIIRGGGIAGISTRTELASEALPAEAGRRLEELASAVAPAIDSGGRASHPDEMLYEIQVDGATATYSETTLPEPMRALIDFVAERPERREGILKRT